MAGTRSHDRASVEVALLTLLLAACSGGGASDAAIDAPADAASDDAGADGGDVDAGPGAPMAMTTFGPVSGSTSDGVQAFLGIPYAAPPVGALRWRPPQAPTPWTTTRRATRAASACLQNVMGLHLGGEDCLYVNVHTPDPRPTHAPVMVWVHGGAWVVGEGLETDGGTAGDVLAREQGVVVVSMNYRLGQLGFLAHAALDAESADHVSGNYGFLDQVAALQWVHDNIAAFGGDPANVTLFGESAGGAAVCAHLVAGESRGLFQRAISESGPCGLPMDTLATAEAQGATFAHDLGCDTGDVAACLRTQSATDVLATMPPPPTVIGVRGPTVGKWMPIVDGHVFSMPWVDAIDAGDVANVPVIVGWNRDEGTIFLSLAESMGAPPVDASNYHDQIAAFLGTPAADAVVTQYPPSAFGGDAHAAAARALGDGVLICTARKAALALVSRHVPLHAYFFTFPDAHFQSPSSFPLGAFHSAEIQFVFGHPVGELEFGADELTLHDAVAGYWARFATQEGDPNGVGAPTWPAYDATSGARLVLDRTIAPGTDDYASTCAFWDTLSLPI